MIDMKLCAGRGFPICCPLAIHLDFPATSRNKREDDSNTDDDFFLLITFFLLPHECQHGEPRLLHFQVYRVCCNTRLSKLDVSCAASN